VAVHVKKNKQNSRHNFKVESTGLSGRLAEIGEENK
jgi:hypothetical protein